jgi:acyl CoA:acetate/3-ketoacid CoA transferase alpha subunit
MTNLLTRRLALFRIASVAGASAVAAAPVALAAVQPKTPENPQLLAAGQRLIAEADECVRLAHIRPKRAPKS